MPRKKPDIIAKQQFQDGKLAFEADDKETALRELTKARQYYYRAREYAILAEIHRMLGEIYFEKGKYKESRSNYKRAYSSFKRLKNKIGMADCYDQITITFLIQEELLHAEEYQLKAISIRRETPDKKGLARALKNLAVIQYQMVEDGEKALSSLKEALALAEKSKDPQLIINIVLDQAKILTKMTRYEVALKSILLARKLSKDYSIPLTEENEEEFGTLLLNYGLELYDTGQKQEALKYLKRALNVLKAQKNPLVESIERTITKIEAALR